MPLSRVAQRYGQALFQSAKDKQLLDTVAGEIEALRDLLRNSRDLRLVVADPILAKDVKKDVLAKLFDSRFNPFLVNFLKFLVDKRRLNLIADIADVFAQLFTRHQNIAEVEIISAFPLEKAQINQICDQLKSKLHKDVRSIISTDPALIGGFKIKTDDKVYDFSLRSQLDKFRQGIRTI